MLALNDEGTDLRSGGCVFHNFVCVVAPLVLMMIVTFSIALARTHPA